MYIKNNKHYADAGKYLACGLTVGYEFPTDVDVTEHNVLLYDMELRTAKSGAVNAHCTDGKISFGVKSSDSDVPTYAGLKTRIIKMRYSNDDQIAIMLNKDSGDEERLAEYQRMQEWREYATNVAHKIMELVEN
ncbi:MAG: hypothetical protein KBS42_05140 [Bacteroidales bacterium]|nr:hypothetical protein [Candidatus Colicola coprequi]